MFKEDPPLILSRPLPLPLSQPFLIAVQEEDPPLLLKMTRDTEQLPFMSALGAFELRVAYANATYDHLVGWRTSCIRREGELPKLPKKWPDEKYKFIMGVEDCAAIPLSERASEGGSSASMRTSSSECPEGENVLVCESGILDTPVLYTE